MTDQSDESAATLSIGAVSKATGISADTLRTWERRYGYPAPERTDGGHRLYRLETIEQLRLITQALELGHRPGQIVGAPRETIEELVEAVEASPASSSSEEPEGAAAPELWDRDRLKSPREQIEGWLEAARAFDASSLERSFQRAWYTLGVVTFLEQYASRFVREIGEAWAGGRLEIAHEHFASERIRDFLTTQWRPLSDRSEGPRVICANLPGEQHNLGLHMVAVMMAVSGFQVIFLGADTPIEEITLSAEQIEGTRGVMLSVSRATNPMLVRRDLSQLRAKLPERCYLLVGGGGAPRDVAGVRVFDSLRELGQWAPNLFLHQLDSGSAEEG